MVDLHDTMEGKAMRLLGRIAHRSVRCGNTIFPMILNSFREISLILWRQSVELFCADETLNMVRAYTELIGKGEGKRAAELFSENCAEFIRLASGGKEDDRL